VTEHVPPAQYSSRASQSPSDAQEISQRKGTEPTVFTQRALGSHFSTTLDERSTPFSSVHDVVA
jgi:hypothetical protein